MRQSTGPRWRFLTRGVSLKTFLLALVPVGAWILFLILFVSGYRVVVHVGGRVRVALDIVRSLVEIATMAIALKYFFDILKRGAANDFSVDSKDRP